MSVGRPGSWSKPKKVMSEWMKETNLGKLQLSATLSAMPLIRCIQINGGRCKRATCLPSSVSESVREREAIHFLHSARGEMAFAEVVKAINWRFLRNTLFSALSFPGKRETLLCFYRLRPQASIPSFIPFIRHYRGREPYFGRKAKLEFDEEKSLQR